MLIRLELSNVYLMILTTMSKITRRKSNCLRWNVLRNQQASWKTGHKTLREKQKVEMKNLVAITSIMVN